MNHKVHNVGAAEKIGRYSDAIEAAPQAGSSEHGKILDLSPTLIVEQADSPQESGETVPDYAQIRDTILKTWDTFSPTQINRHTRTYGAAKTLEVIEAAARLGSPDINEVVLDQRTSQ
jgi:hypothetical protein